MSEEELLQLLEEHGVTETEIRAWLRVRSLTTSHRTTSPGASDTVTVDDIDSLGAIMAPEIDVVPRVAQKTDDDVPDGYDNLGIIGHGATSVIHRVGDRNLKRSMAAKILRPELMLNPEAWSRFVEEAQITAHLQHPGIVPVHELGRLADGRHYFTMKEIQGRTLSLAIRDVHEASQEDMWGTAASGWTFRRLIAAFQKACDAWPMRMSVRSCTVT